MKLYLASLLEPNNFGPGRVIGIINPVGGKPKTTKLDSIFEPFTPKPDTIAKYNRSRPIDGIVASSTFVLEYKKQLQNFLLDIKKTASENDVTITDLLPFQDGDTLASWERADFTNYRKVLAPFLEEMGFEVILK